MASTHPSLLVALHGGTLSGIDTYAEQIAVTAAGVGYDVTLLAIGEKTGAGLERRLRGHRIRVLATADVARTALARLARQVPGVSMAEMRALVEGALKGAAVHTDVAHVNHPGLAPAVRPFAERVTAGAWFYPHAAGGRMAETWRHTGRHVPRRAAFALKGLAHYLNDRAGYPACDAVAAPTERLARQLRALGIHAAVCPPPTQPLARTRIEAEAKPVGAWRITICAGDLSHPRKNVPAAIAAVGILGRQGHMIELVLIGPRADRLQREMSVLPPSVTVRAMGPLSRNETEGWFGSSDVLVVPSLYEEWGYVATEAMMTGTPVAAFSVYPFDEMLSASLGACARDMSARALAEAIVRAVGRGGDRRAVKAAASARFGAAATARQLSAMWTVTAGPSRPAKIAAVTAGTR